MNIKVAVFDDRIEITNPGFLPFGLTIEAALSGVSKLRNRVIGRVFRELDLIEHGGGFFGGGGGGIFDSLTGGGGEGGGTTEEVYYHCQDCGHEWK